jgi:TonB-linked SusC/RagA family outer membrane protein
MMRLFRSISCAIAFLLIAASPAIGQSGEIAGTVTDAETGNPLPGVNVVIAGTQQGAATNADGEYVITNVEPGTYDLRASFISYASRLVEGVVVEAGATTTQNFQLTEATAKLDEIVVTGIGEQSRRTLTTSIAKLDTAALENVPYTNVASALSGTIAGLRVQTTTGQPGASPQIVLRGGTSINNPDGAEPLYVVDGIIRPSLNDLSALDIESIQVLKDAASTSIYGARGSNGVVVVTTKSGQAGQTSVTYTASLTNNQLQQRRDLGSAREYIKYGRLGVAATGELTPSRLGRLDLPVGFGTGNDLTKQTAFTTQYLTDENRHKLDEGWESMPDPLNPDRTIIFKDTDWQDVLFRNALTQNHHLSISGGAENATFHAALGFMDANGIAIQTGYRRATLNMSGNLDVRDNLRLGGQLNLSNSSDKLTGFADNWIFQRALGLPPTAKLRYEDGTLAPGQNISIGNPLYFLDVFEGDNSTNKLTVALNGLWEITPGLTFEPSASLYQIRGRSWEFEPTYQFAAGQLIDSRDAFESRSLRSQGQAEGIFTYSNTFSSAHNVELKAGGSYYHRHFNQLSASGRGASSDYIPTLNASAEETSVFSEETDRRIIGGFGRAQYDYDRKYLFSASFRYDGASNLGANNRWGFFPGISAGWNVHEEDFWAVVPSSFISNLKLRASYGVTGNISGLSDFHAQGQYSVGSEYAGVPAVQNTRLTNQDLQWERSTTFDVGLDLGVYNDRVTFIADYYRRLTDNLLTSFQLPRSTGFISLLTNLGALRNTGLEFELGADIIQSQDFMWTASINAAWNQNKIVELPENQNENNRIGGIEVYDPESGEYVWVGGLQEGEPLGNMYAYHHIGVYTTEEQLDDAPTDELIPGTDKTKRLGDAIFEDLDGNGVIDPRDRVYAGNVYPDWTGGFSSLLQYKNVSLRVRADFATGHTIRNHTLATLNGQFQGDINISEEVLDSWQEPGDQTNIPRYYWADQLAHNNMFRGTTYYHEDGDYLAIREITLSYTFPDQWLNPLGLSRSHIYATGSNLGYITAYKGLLPEEGGFDDGRYPAPRSFTMGVNITLR